VSSAPRFLRLERKIYPNTDSTRSSTTIAAPMPMPALAPTLRPEADEATGPVVDSAPVLELEVEKVVGEATPLDGETAPVLVEGKLLVVVEEALVTVWRDDELCES
jgi:hypothetical protein